VHRNHHAVHTLRVVTHQEVVTVFVASLRPVYPRDFAHPEHHADAVLLHVVGQVAAAEGLLGQHGSVLHVEVAFPELAVGLRLRAVVDGVEFICAGDAIIYQLGELVFLKPRIIIKLF